MHLHITTLDNQKYRITESFTGYNLRAFNSARENIYSYVKRKVTGASSQKLLLICSRGLLHYLLFLELLCKVSQMLMRACS